MTDSAKRRLGLGASAFFTVLSMPLDVAISLAQVQTHSSVRTLIAQQVRQHGVSSLFRGGGCSLLGKGAFFSITLPVSNMLRQPHHSLPTRIAQTCAVSAVGVALVNPFFVAKIRYQTMAAHDVRSTRQPPPRSLWHCWRTIIANEGTRALYKGVGVSVVKSVEFGLVKPCADELQERYDMSPAAAMASARVCGNTIMYPLDTTRTLQRDTVGRTPLLDILSILYAQGVKRMYRGFTWYVLRSAPPAIFAYSLYNMRQQP